HDLRVLAATDEPQFHVTRDLLPEADAARALDAAGHLLGRDERPQLLAKYDALRFLVARSRRTVPDREILQLAFAALIADRAVERVVDEQELHHALLRLDGLVALGAHDHALRHRCRA